ncbi:MAG: GNAT family N-acetyltransferase [Anaerolineae bacterium]|nr:GNAT family N-acetyltransferase [Anaerolineae bacterium]
MNTVVYRDATIDDAPALARVSVDTWRTTYRGIMPASILDGLSYERSEANWRTGLENPQSKTFVRVATDGSANVFGFAGAGPVRDGSYGFDSEIYALYVLQSMQRGGAGRGLVASAVINLMARGCESMLIWVLRDNSIGRAFYQRMGGLQVAEREIDIRGVMLPEIGYGWRDLARSIKHDFRRLD